MVSAAHSKEMMAVELAMAVKHLKARLREEMTADAAGLSMSQLSVLHRLCVDGPATAVELAGLEHVSQQAIAQSVTPLKAAGLVELQPDSSDKRKLRISVTAAGRKLRNSMIASRNAWLVKAIDATLQPNEQPELRKTIELLERLADAKLERV